MINKATAQWADANLAAKCGLGPCHVGDLGWLHRLPEGKRRRHGAIHCRHAMGRHDSNLLFTRSKILTSTKALLGAVHEAADWESAGWHPWTAWKRPGHRTAGCLSGRSRAPRCPT